MINLLPPDYSSTLKLGRLNARLRIWLVAVLAACGGLVLILFAGWLYIDHQISGISGDIAGTQAQLQSQNLSAVQAQADQISKNLRLINQILGREINFSNLIQDIGKAMPSGSILGSLSLSKVSGAIDLSANSKDYAAAVQVAVNLGDPKNNIFSKVDIVSISCTGTGPYPCEGTFRALFGNNTANRYLNAPKAGS